MASEYLDADRHGLLLLAHLIDQYWAKPTVKLAAEIRAQEARFGLSPIDRRRLQWEVSRVERRDNQAKPAAAPGTSAEDPRQLLKAVK